MVHVCKHYAKILFFYELNHSDTPFLLTSAVKNDPMITHRTNYADMSSYYMCVLVTW